MFRKPRWSVTWPTRPNGVHTVLVRADDPTDAVRVASEQDPSVTGGYALAFDYEPQVWRLRRPYWWRSRPATGPDYPDMTPGEAGFTPVPVDLRKVADEVVSEIRAAHGFDKSQGEVRAIVGQIVSHLTPAQVEAVLAQVIDETRAINEFTRGEAAR